MDLINIALPKGRLGEKVYQIFEEVGYECPSIREENRKLIFENPKLGVRYFWVKPTDVPIYVERGAADVGVAGKDILLEYQPRTYHPGPPHDRVSGEQRTDLCHEKPGTLHCLLYPRLCHDERLRRGIR